MKAAAMIALVPGDATSAVPIGFTDECSRLNQDNGQGDSERISILQEGDKYEADTTAP